ncbi:hypothetical protein [Arenibacter certesii]|uniref:Lipoprotein n=1 Tax=Arenibacter certesii TaxID=228955 RepID=A0A918J1N4_9FLAO|nr:hypothetical protein [Arenibacter certesii]GGW42398.1 hypothetical protein GCM10007383_28690 [Arenibacter certesii]
MNKYSIFMMCILLLGLLACNEENKKSTNNSRTDSDSESRIEARNAAHEKTMRNNPELVPSSTEDNWGQDYNRNMDISKMYGDLDMTEKQISDYEAYSKAYREKLSAHKNNGSADNQAILVNKDSSLKSVLTPEQYKKYKTMLEKRKNDND